MSFELNDRDPGADRFEALLASTMLVPAGMIVGLVLAGIFGFWSSPLGWIMIVLAGASGLAPVVRWYRRQSTTVQISVFGIDRGRRSHLAAGADAVDRIERARRAVSAGPVADHLLRVEAEAIRYLRAMEGALRNGSTHLVAEMDHIRSELDRLATAAEDLAGTAIAGSPRALRDLTERTELMDQLLRAEFGDEAQLPSMPMFEGHAADEAADVSAVRDGDDSPRPGGSTSDR